MRLLVSLVLLAMGIGHDRAGSALGGRLVDRDRCCGTGNWHHFLCRLFADHALFCQEVENSISLTRAKPSVFAPSTCAARRRPNLPLSHDSIILKVKCRFTNTNALPVVIPRHT
jgi:hypothetical protein